MKALLALQLLTLGLFVFVPSHSGSQSPEYVNLCTFYNKDPFALTLDSFTRIATIVDCESTFVGQTYPEANEFRCTRAGVHNFDYNQLDYLECSRMDKPLPPNVLASALQDRIHPASGKLLASKPVRTRAQQEVAK